MCISFVPSWKATNSPFAPDSPTREATIVEVSASLMTVKIRHSRVFLVAIFVRANEDLSRLGAVGGFEYSAFCSMEVHVQLA
jgi:hypothetical protein